jgi:MoaA/NifB/PqqE/SkfB family radical SAM enzyme
MLKYLNLALASRCSLNCAFCPNSKAPRAESVTLMPPATAEAVLRDARSYPIARVDVGEMGDAFLNPQALDIMRRIRHHLPDSEIRVFTNFQTFVPDLIDTVLEEHLLDHVITNMDGATPETYRAVKGGSYKRAVQHITHFLEKRASAKSPTFRMQVLTLHDYVKTVRDNLGRDPRHVDPNLLNTPDDFEEIQHQWQDFGIVPERSFVCLWAETPAPARPRTLRAKVRHLRRRNQCRLLPRLRESLFVAPEGETYLCCADYDVEQRTGHIDDGLASILDGDRRRRLLAAIARKDFKSAGGPCRHYPLCQSF